MGKRGGSNGYLKPKLASNSEMFDRRGNPWDKSRQTVSGQPIEITDVSVKIDEALMEMGLNPRNGESVMRQHRRQAIIDDPEFDQFFCKKAEAKPVFVDPPAKKREVDYKIRMANALHVMNREIKPQTVTVPNNSMKTTVQRTEAERTRHQNPHVSDAERQMLIQKRRDKGLKD